MAPILWTLWQAPGDPEIENLGGTIAMLGLWAILLLRGSKLGWAVGTAYTGAFEIFFVYQLFDPSSEPSSALVQAGLLAFTAVQFVLLIRPATMDWVGVRGGRALSPG